MHYQRLSSCSWQEESFASGAGTLGDPAIDDITNSKGARPPVHILLGTLLVRRSRQCTVNDSSKLMEPSEPRLKLLLT